MKNLLVLFLVNLSFVCYSQSTSLKIESKDSVDIYKILKITSEDSESLFPSRRYDNSSMELIGKTPIELQLENGVYNFNVGGNNRYSKAFNIIASGKDISVHITGDYKKVSKDNYWVLGFGVGTIISLTTVKLINDQLDPNKSIIGFILPITMGSGFCVSLGKWIYDKPRVKILY